MDHAEDRPLHVIERRGKIQFKNKIHLIKEYPIKRTLAKVFILELLCFKLFIFQCPDAKEFAKFPLNLTQIYFASQMSN